MAAELVVAPQAEQDIADAYSWYEAQRDGLGEVFLASVDACIQTILSNPEQFRTVYKDYRRDLVRRFPYGVFYEHTDEGVVTVYCVFHTSREPEKWRQRLP